MRFGLAWIQAHELETGGLNFGLPLYASCAVLQVILVAGGALLLKEPRPAVPAPAVRFSFRGYFSILREHPPLRRFAIINTCHGIYYGSAIDFAILFGTVTLGMSKTDYGGFAGWAPLLAIASAFPTAWANRMLPRNRLLAAFACGQVIVCTTCLLTDSPLVFGLMLWLNVLCLAMREVTFRAFSTEFYPPGQAGQALGAVQVFFGLGRMLSLLMVGQIIMLAGTNYRLAWAIGGACSLVAMIVAARIPEPRREAVANPV